MEKLPLVAISASRKEGWLLIPKDEEQYVSIYALIRRAGKAEMTAGSRTLSESDFSALTAVASPSEKLLFSPKPMALKRPPCTSVSTMAH